MMSLTRRQQEALDFVRSYLAEHGIAPTLKEISAHLKTGGAQNARTILIHLEQRGYIRRLRYRPRAIEIVDLGERYKVAVDRNLMPLLIGYADAERIAVEVAVNQFIRDGLESA
jgi:repressor LexA